MHIDGEFYRHGERVRIKNIKGGGDEDLNGQIGIVTYRDPKIPFGCIGVFLEPKKSGIRVRANLCWNEFEKTEVE